LLLFALVLVSNLLPPGSPRAIAATIPGEAPTNFFGPKIQFATPVFDFHRAAPGDSVKYSFIFTNAGTARLTISSVRPDCGCTTADNWTRRVEPGKTGVVPVQLNVADNWPSGPINKTLAVDSNDPRQPTVVLKIRGDIWKPIDVAPMLASFNLVADSPAVSNSVRILNHTEAPLVLYAPELDHSGFTLALRTNRPGKEFELIITAQPPFAPGPMQAQARIKTSYKTLREIAVPIYAVVQPVITVMPPQLILRARAPGTRYSPKITIQNNGTNFLKLFEPQVNAKNVGVQIQETQPGQVFVATLTFPPDFVIPAGNPVTFTVKSSCTQFPLIKVPILPMARCAE
jgi:hypothetical protein